MIDRQFHDMNSGAHRRPATKIAAPAIVWQQNFWRPSAGEGDNKPPQSTIDQGWYDSIDTLLYNLYNCISIKNTSFFECHNLAKGDKDDKDDKDTDDYLCLFRNKINISSQGNHNLKKLENHERAIRHDV